jgi:hypothetical protein
MNEKPTTKKLTPAARKARNAQRTARGVFAAGLIVSLAANVAASQHNVAGIASGLWAPLGLLAALALLENGSVRGTWAKVAVGFLAVVAGWTSYWHLVEVLEMAGVHDPVTLYLLPLTVDVLMAIASPGMKARRTAPARRRPAAKKAATNVRKLRAA